MFRNYFSTAIHNLMKNKLFSTINIVGLAVGLAACILIGLYVQDETSYDRQWENTERIFRFNTTLNAAGDNPVRYGVNALGFLLALERFFPDQIEAGARTVLRDYEVHLDSARFNESIAETDLELLEIFDFEVLAGSLEATLEAPDRIALSEEVAGRFFGDGQALGRTLTLVNSDGSNETVRDYSVSAVYRLPEGNTVLELPAMALLEESRYPYLANCCSLASIDHVLLSPDADIERMTSRLPVFTDENIDISALGEGPGVAPRDRVSFDLQPIADVYLDPPVAVDGGNPAVILAFSAISVLVLLIGCINFTILSTAKATQRAVEVAMRKAIGATRGQLMRQFLGESLLLVLGAMVLALVFVEAALPVFSAFVGNELAVDYASVYTWFALAALLAIVGFAGGLYPAFVLSWFRPAAAVKGDRFSESGRSITLRNTLVVFQFAISIALMVATAVIYMQVQYAVNRDPGFDPDNLLVLYGFLNRPDVDARKDALRQQVGELPAVSSTALSGHRPMHRQGVSTLVLDYNLQDSPRDNIRLATLPVGYDFFGTYGIPVQAGRVFSEERDQASRFFDFNANPGESYRASTVINLEAARALGFADPREAIGRQISRTSPFNDTRQMLTVIGIVGDTQFFSLRSEPRAEIYVLAPGYTDALTIRYRGEPQAILSSIGEVWDSVMGSDVALFSSFVDQTLAGEFAREAAQARIVLGFSALAILIACLGLFGSAAFNVERRTKEIGIRKVMGAEVREIVRLLLWQFSKPVMFANVIAWPIAIWVMMNWLQRFTYQIDAWLLLPLCAAAGLAAMTIAVLTVAGNTWRAATINPVYSLRYE